MSNQPHADHEFAFEMAASGIRFGFGATREVGADLADLGLRQALVFTDPVLRSLAPVNTVIQSPRRKRHRVYAVRPGAN